MIPIDLFERTAEALMSEVAIEIPEDYLDGRKAAADTEVGDVSPFVHVAMLDYYEAAKRYRRTMCGNTGRPRWYAKIGNEMQVEGGPITLEVALRRARAKATQQVPLRSNCAHSLWRTNHDNNVGIGAPEIEHSYGPGGEWIDPIGVHRGSLFGNNYRMLFPLDGIQRRKRCRETDDRPDEVVG